MVLNKKSYMNVYFRSTEKESTKFHGHSTRNMTSPVKINHGNRTMKINCLRACDLAIVAGGLVLVSGCIVRSEGRQPVYMVQQPAPPPMTSVPQPMYTNQQQIQQPVYVTPQPVMVRAPVMVPDYYVWDGFEWVGVVGGQYCYLGPNNVWLVCEPFRLERFHGWERGHSDWREHSIHNDHFKPDHNERGQSRRNGRF